MPIQHDQQQHVSLSFRLQDGLSRLVREKKILIPNSLEADGSLRIQLNDLNCLNETTAIFIVNRQGDNSEIKDYPDAPILSLIKKIYGDENVEVSNDTLTVKSSRSQGKGNGSTYEQALYYTEFHNARADENSKAR